MAFNRVIWQREAPREQCNRAPQQVHLLVHTLAFYTVQPFCQSILQRLVFTELMFNEEWEYRKSPSPYLKIDLKSISYIGDNTNQRSHLKSFTFFLPSELKYKKCIHNHNTHLVILCLCYIYMPVMATTPSDSSLFLNFGSLLHTCQELDDILSPQILETVCHCKGAMPPQMDCVWLRNSPAHNMRHSYYLTWRKLKSVFPKILLLKENSLSKTCTVAQVALQSFHSIIMVFVKYKRQNKYIT